MQLVKKSSVLSVENGGLEIVTQAPATGRGRKVVAGALLALGTAGLACATDPTIDLSSVTTGISAAQVAMVGIAAAIIGAGIAVGAIKWGARFGIGLFKIFGR